MTLVTERGMGWDGRGKHSYSIAAIVQHSTARSVALRTAGHAQTPVGTHGASLQAADRSFN